MRATARPGPGTRVAPLLEAADVAAVWDRLSHLEIRVLSFCVSSGDGESRAMLVERIQQDTVDLMGAVGWGAWEQGWQDDYSGTQLHVAHAEIARSGQRPDHSAN